MDQLKTLEHTRQWNRTIDIQVDSGSINLKTPGRASSIAVGSFFILHMERETEKTNRRHMNSHTTHTHAHKGRRRAIGTGHAGKAGKQHAQARCKRAETDTHKTPGAHLPPFFNTSLQLTADHRSRGRGLNRVVSHEPPPQQERVQVKGSKDPYSELEQVDPAR
jgi:hypothetical protein